MLKTYEAIYKNGFLRWLDQKPTEPDQELHVLVVVEVNETQPRIYNQSNDKPVEKIDLEFDEKWQKWLNRHLS
jgi:hypothetical protein